MKRNTFLFSISLGVSFDILFWDKSPGISFFIFILALLILATIVLKQKKINPVTKGLYFLIPIGIFSVLSFTFAEPLLSFLNRAVVLLLFGFWAASFQKGEWLRFGFIDHVISGLRLMLNLISFPWLRVPSLHFFQKKDKKTIRGIRPYIRGIILSLPFLAIFLALFASADLVFADGVNHFLSLFNIQHIVEYLVRIFLVFFIANAFLGLIIFSMKNERKITFIGEEDPFIKPFLGEIESGIVIISVLLLFLTFIVIQFRYFFFNQAAIANLGYSYSEYARRGFGELIATSVINLTLILILNTVTKPSKNNSKRIFPGLQTGLISGNLIILTSAFMRLSLYETIFGFTRLRTYSYIFIIWLGLLLIAVSILIWTRKIRLFTNLAIIASISFVATLNLLNPDAFITDQNISRAVGEELLDRAYLGSLSTDAIPALVEHFSSDNNKSSKTEIGTAILCFQTLHEEQLKTSSWQSFSISNWRAKELLIKTMPQLTDFEIKQEDWATIIVDKNGKETLCSDNLFFD